MRSAIEVDSAIAAQTADRIRLQVDDWPQWATPRGCSTRIDEILDRGGSG